MSNDEINRKNVAGDDEEFSASDLKFVNMEFTSVANVERVKTQAQQFVRGSRTLSQSHYINLMIGIKKTFMIYKKEYAERTDDEGKQGIINAIRDVACLATKLRGIRNGTLFPEFEGNENYLRASRFGLDPENRWYDVDQKGRKTFNHVECGKDIIEHELKGKIVTEYGSGIIHVFVGDRYLIDGEPFLRSLVQYHARLDHLQISKVVEYIRNMTRVVDPKKIGLSMDEIMPVPSGLIPLDNGLFDVSTKTLHAHSPAYYYAAHLPRNYISGGRSSKFRNLLEIMFTGDPEKEKKVTQIFEILAWTLTDGYTPQGSATLIGSGGEGKSIIIGTIMSFLGTQNVAAISIQELESDKFKRAELYGKFANLVSGAGGIIKSELYKRFTDFSPITADNKNGRNFNFRSRAKWIISTNELMETKDHLRAFHRRTAALVVFENYLENLITPQEISEFVEALQGPHELDLIFSEVVDLYMIPFMERKKFTGQLSVEEAEEQYTDYANPSLAYMNDQLSNDRIFADIDDALEYAKNNGIDLDMITKEDKKKGNLSIITIKKFIEKDAKQWAKSRKLQSDLIDTVKLGKALETAGFPNIVCEKKVAKTGLRAWLGVFIAPVFPESMSVVTGTNSEKKIRNDERRTLDSFRKGDINKNNVMPDNNLNESRVTVNQNGALPNNSQENTHEIDDRSRYPPHVEQNIKKESTTKGGIWEGGVTSQRCNKENTASNEVTAGFCDPLPDVSVTSKSMVNNDVSNTKSPNTTTNELNQSYLMEKTVIAAIEKIMSANKNSKIGTDEILNNWTNGVDKPSFKELDERILPTMAASGLLSIHNETVKLTGNPMSGTPPAHHPPGTSSLTHLSILEDIPEFSWTDGDWKLRKNDDAYVPSELAKTLINRGWAREISKTCGF